MDDKQRKKLVKNTIEATMSLLTAIEDAGGAVPAFISTEVLEKMSMLDFIAQVAAPNNIRFYFTKPEKQK